ncbi:MAG: hypothetical protein HN976_44215 [Lentisphaerae bacterium]|nr:hypothetical protein [Lentisphaerota bacterium]
MEKRGMLSVALATLVLGLGCTVTVSAGVPRPKHRTLDLPSAWKGVTPKARIMALTAAKADARRALGERVLGIMLKSGATVKDCLEASSRVEGAFQGVLTGASATEKTEYRDDGTVEVVYGVTLRKVMEVIRKGVRRTDTGGIKQISETSYENQDRLIEALGCSAALRTRGAKLVQAKRAAEMEAYSEMAKRVLGVKISSATRVKDACLESDEVMESVSGLLKGIKPTEYFYNDDDSATVSMQLKMREVIETIETITRHYRQGKKTSKETLKTVNHDIVDRVYTVTGHGVCKQVPQKVTQTRPPKKAAAPKELYKEEITIIKRIIDQGMVVE